MIARGPVDILELSIGTFAIQVLSLLTRSTSPISHHKLARASTIPFLAILILPILQFVIVPIVGNPPSPFPFSTGWDVFTYIMIGGRIQSGFTVSPITTINPITQQLPIPTAFPILVALLMPPGISRPESAVALIKYGPVIPCLLSMAWVFLICRQVTKNSHLSLVGTLVAYSFSGYNIIDTKYFLPASFSWTFALMGVYAALLQSGPRGKIILFALASATAVFFHFYSGAAATAITVTGVIISNIPRLHFPNLANRFTEFYPIWGGFAVLALNLLGLSFNIPGAGTVVGGPGLLTTDVELMLRSLSPAFWILAIISALYAFAYRRNLRMPDFHFLLLGLLIYFLPISGIFRLLIWPGLFAAVATSRILAAVFSGPWKGIHQRGPTLFKMSAILLVSLALVSAAYPLLVPFNYAPTYYVNAGNSGTVQSTYSMTEYSAAVYLAAHPPAPNYIILSDPGFSLVLGGLTGGDAVRLTQLSNMLPFQELLQTAEVGPINASIAYKLHELLGAYYDLPSYGGVVLALSARTYYWIRNDGIITYSPLNSSFVDGNIRSNFVDSAPLLHVYSSQDVDMFYLAFKTGQSSP